MLDGACCKKCESYRSEVEKLHLELKSVKLNFVKEKSILEQKIRNFEEENSELVKRLGKVKNLNLMILENFEMRSVNKEVKKDIKEDESTLENELKRAKLEFFRTEKKLKFQVKKILKKKFDEKIDEMKKEKNQVDEEYNKLKCGFFELRKSFEILKKKNLKMNFDFREKCSENKRKISSLYINLIIF